MSANNSTDEMYVTKRDGESEIVSFDKILTRIKKIGKEANIKINYTSLVIKIIDQLYDKISTTKIDELMAEQCASMSSIHYDYGTLASRLIISNHHKNTSSTFSHVMNQLYNNRDKHDKHCPLISDELYLIISNPIHRDRIDSYIQHDRDYLFDYFGFKTLERSYLMRINRIVIERPQHMWMRVALAIHADNLEKAFETYDLMSQKYFTHATPTLFNAGTRHQQLSSCYLIAMEEDSIEGIYNTLKDCALISKWAGGIGLHIHNIRASNSQIRGTNGTSNGIVPMLRVFNNTAKYVDQCFASTTNIYTKNGAVSFYELTADTDVYNNTGSTEKIESILNYDKPGEVLNKIKIYDEEKTDFPSLLCTGEHPICILSATEDDTATIDNDLKLGLKEFSWTPASELVVGDFIVNKIPDYLNDDESISVEMATLYGLLFARAEIPFSDPSNYYFADSGNLLLQADSNGTRFWSTYMSGVDYSFKTTWDGRPFLSIDKSLTDLTFFNMRNEKRIDSRYLYLSETKTRALIDAYFASTSAYNPDIQFLCLRLGDMRYFKENSCHVLRDTGFVLIPIQRIEQSSEFWNGQVHDLQMPSVHNYMTEFGLVHNGGGKRNGSIAVYLEPWHADIELFLEMRKNHGDEEMKARDLFYSLWIPDLFMKRVKEDAEWTLMCPDECPGLADVWGERFEELYQSYEKSGKGRKTMKARELWFKVLDAQMETGTPYLCYKDAANRKSNQQNLGTIKSSNLCSEIMQYSDHKETAVCNLASIALPTFVNEETKQMDYEKLHEVAKVVTYNLNRVIDINFYPTEKTRRSNLRHRPIGIGVQGLADVFMKMDIAFHSEQAREVNRLIFETIYHGAVERSYEIARDLTNQNECKEDEYNMYPGAYETFMGSPASQGLLQFDLWGVKPTEGRYDWKALKENIQNYGMRNSLLMAPMPTASTSQILGYNECFEPFTSNIYSRRTLAGEFVLTNKYLMRDLMDCGMWTERVKNNIIANQGSVQQLEGLSEHLKQKYKTVWEIPMRHVIDMASDRGAFICQSQSLNLWMEDPNYAALTSMHFHAWQKGLKTGIYYLRRRARHKAQQFTIEPEKMKRTYVQEDQQEGCTMCSA